jgi:hypothetical protein
MPPGREDSMGGWRQPTREERESSAMGRFELVCEAYSDASELQRSRMLALLNEDERQVFLKGCGLYRIFRDQRLYDAIKSAVGEQIYKDAHKEE